jgi:hypothetical protein
MSIIGSRVVIALLVFGFVFMVGCGSTNLNMDVQTYPVPGKDVGNGKTFKIFLKNEQFPELEVELLNIANRELKKKSYIYEDNNPDFAVMIDFTNSLLKSRKKTEPVYVSTDRTRYDTCYAAGTSNLHQVSSTDLDVFTQYAGETQAPVSLTESGKGHYTDIRLFIIDYRRMMEKQEIDVVWKGRVSNLGSKSELKKLAPHLIRELLDEFPTQSGKKSHRVVKIK